MESAPNKRSYIPLAAMRCLLRGMSRREVCEVFSRGNRVVRLWILKYNAGGHRRAAEQARKRQAAGGRRRKVSLQRIWDILVPSLNDPRLSYATVIRYLHELDFHLRVPRPWPLPLLDEPEREEQR